MELLPQEIQQQGQTHLVSGCLLREVSQDPSLLELAQEPRCLGNLLQVKEQLVNLQEDQFSEAISLQLELSNLARQALSKRLCHLLKPNQHRPPQALYLAKVALVPPSLAPPCLVASRQGKHQLVPAQGVPRLMLVWAVARYLVKPARNLELQHTPIHSGSQLSLQDPYFHKLLRQAQVHSSHQPSLLAPQVSQVSASLRSQPCQLIRLDLCLEGRWVQLHRVSGQYCRQQRRSNERTVCGYSESMNKLLNPKARKTDSEAVSSTRL